MNEQLVSKRNYIFMIIEGALIFTAFTFIDSGSVVPVFIHTFTGNLELAGLATTFRQVSFFIPQLAAGLFINKIKNIPAFISLMMLVFRSLPILMAPVLLAVQESYTVVWIFLLIFCTYFISEGIMNIPWWDVFSRTIPVERRGKLLGYQQLLGGIGGLAGGLIIKTILDSSELSLAVKYALIFGIGGFAGMLSGFAMLQVRDSSKRIIGKTENLLKYLSRMPVYFIRNREFISLTKVQVLSYFTGMAAPLIIIFCKDTFKLNPSDVSTLVYVQIAGTLVGGVVWGNISHKLGNKYAIMVSQLNTLAINTISTAAVLFGGTSPHFTVLWLIVLLAGINMGSWLGFSNYILDITGEEDRSVYLVLNSIIVFPLTSLYYFAGLIADNFGFLPVFITGAASAVAAVIFSLRLKPANQ